MMSFVAGDRRSGNAMGAFRTFLYREWRLLPVNGGWRECETRTIKSEQMKKRRFTFTSSLLKTMPEIHLGRDRPRFSGHHASPSLIALVCYHLFGICSSLFLQSKNGEVW